MDRNQTVARIAELLHEWSDDPECPRPSDADAVYLQMPATLAALADGEAVEFEQLVRLAAHDVYRFAEL